MTPRESELIAALRDAAAHIEAQRRLICDIMEQWALDAESKADSRAWDRSVGTYMPGYEERVVRKACDDLGIKYTDAIETDACGVLKRERRNVRARESLILWLRLPRATPTGQMSLPQIAKGLRLPNHSTIIAAERRVKERMLKQERKTA